MTKGFPLQLHLNHVIYSLLNNNINVNINVYETYVNCSEHYMSMTVTINLTTRVSRGKLLYLKS